MIKSFAHRGLERFFRTGNASKLTVRNTDRIARILDLLDDAERPEDANVPGWRFHELKGDRKGTYSVTVTANWRITFKWNAGPTTVDLEDYH